MQMLVTFKTLVLTACWLVLLLTSLGGSARAQSTDIAAPLPVRTNEVLGTIAARDLGDPRLTDHFYAFTGTPGDVLITVESKNLNGDVDVFTTNGLRPLLKFTVYAESSSPITKSIYLRTREDLILRVEGRTPNDDEAVYRIRFGGSFAPITGELWLAEREASEASSVTANSRTGKKGRRVSSVGARIEEPAEAPAEVAAAPTPEATPVESAVPGETKTAAPRVASRRSRGRRPAARRTRPAEPEKKEEPAATPTAEAEPGEEASATETKKTSRRRRGTRRSSASRNAPKPPTEAEPESGPRLVIETSDGTLIDRYMSSVRRVTVENGQVVVIGKDGKIQRIQLASVVRMTISP